MSRAGPRHRDHTVGLAASERGFRGDVALENSPCCNGLSAITSSMAPRAPARAWPATGPMTRSGPTVRLGKALMCSSA